MDKFEYKAVSFPLQNCKSRYNPKHLIIQLILVQPCAHIELSLFSKGLLSM